jgi:hypothetical protein
MLLVNLRSAMHTSRGYPLFMLMSSAGVAAATAARNRDAPVGHIGPRGRFRVKLRVADDLVEVMA